jgi:hypothetical protein
MNSRNYAIICAVALACCVVSAANAQVGILTPPARPRDSAAIAQLFKLPPPPALSAPALKLTPGQLDSALHLSVRGGLQCPMPVFSPNSTKQDRMPIARLNPTKVERMPVAAAECSNPLQTRVLPR